MNSDFINVNAWSQRNDLLLNAKKTKAICFSNSCISSATPALIANGETITLDDDVVNLGLKLRKDMSWGAHCNRISSRVFSGLPSLWQQGNVIGRNMRISLVKSLLLPHFTYCCEVFVFGLDACCRKTLNRAFDACIRFAYGLRRRDDLHDYRNELLGCDIIGFLKCRALLFLHKIVLTGTPDYIYEKLRFAQSTRTANLIQPRTSVARTSKSLLFNGISYYNSIPTQVRQSRSGAGWVVRVSVWVRDLR